MANYFKTTKAPHGHLNVWIDNSPASVILNNEFFGAPASTNKLWIKVSGVWKECVTWIKVAGVWKEAEPKTKVAGIWK